MDNSTRPAEQTDGLNFAAGFQKVRRRIALFHLIFFTAGVGSAMDCFYLEHAATPQIIPTYGFAVLFGVVMVTFPLMTYLLNRWIRKLQIGNCPHCHCTLWDSTTTATMIVILQRCSLCGGSLRVTRGFDVQPRQSSGEK